MIKKFFSFISKKIVNMARSSECAWRAITSFSNTSGESVDNTSALTVSTYWAAIRNISEDVAKIPFKVYQKDGSYKYERPNSTLWRLLNYEPNPEMTAISFRETMTSNMMGWGNAFAFIQRDIAGNAVAIWPLRPDRVKLKRDDSDRLYYEITDDTGKQYRELPENIFHPHGLGGDGLLGYNIVEFMSQSVGAAIAIDKFAGSFFGNGLNPCGTLEHPQTLSAEAQSRLVNKLSEQLSGSNNAHGLMVLEEGMKFNPYTISPEASQLIETRKFTVAEFCRWLRIPPHKVADLERATFSNITEQNTDYVTDSLTAWCVRWELEVWRKLITPTEKVQGYYVEHVLEGLLRGDAKSRAEFYKIMWELGVMSPNDIRSKENMNPIDGGNKYFVPMNYNTLDNAGQMDSVVEDVSNRLANAEIAGLEKCVLHHGTEEYGSRLSSFYRKHDEYIKSATAVFKKKVCLDMLSMKAFIVATASPIDTLDRLKNNHSNYIANNLRGYINGTL